MCELVRPCKRIHSICLGKSQCGLDWSCGRTDGLGLSCKETEAPGLGRRLDPRAEHGTSQGSGRSQVSPLKRRPDPFRRIVPGGCLTPWFSSFSAAAVGTWCWHTAQSCKLAMNLWGSLSARTAWTRSWQNKLSLEASSEQASGATLMDYGLHVGWYVALWGLGLACFRQKVPLFIMCSSVQFFF